MMSRRRALIMAQVGAEPPFYINGYVGNGLLHYWDGIDNKGIGYPHASDGLPWVDLAGDMDLPRTWRAEQASWFTEAPFSSKGYVFNRGYRNAMMFPIGNVMLPTWKEFTLEARVPTGSNGAAISFIYTDCNGPLVSLVFRAETIGICYNDNVRYRQVQYITFERPFVDSTLSVSYSGGKISVYVNGVLMTTTEAPPSASVFGSRILSAASKIKVAIGSDAVAAVNGNAFADGHEVYRVSIYDIALNSQQILSNYQNDLTRFAS